MTAVRRMSRTMSNLQIYFELSVVQNVFKMALYYEWNDYDCVLWSIETSRITLYCVFQSSYWSINIGKGVWKSTASKELPENPVLENMQGSPLIYLFACLLDVLKKKNVSLEYCRNIFLVLVVLDIFLVRQQEVSVFKTKPNQTKSNQTKPTKQKSIVIARRTCL